VKGFTIKERHEAAEAIFIAAEMQKAKEEARFCCLSPKETSRYFAQADACLGVAFAAMAPKMMEQRDRIKELEEAGE